MKKRKAKKSEPSTRIPPREDKYAAENGFWTREGIDALYAEAVKKAKELQLPAPDKPTESCSCCGRQRYGWCGCRQSGVGGKRD